MSALTRSAALSAVVLMGVLWSVQAIRAADEAAPSLAPIYDAAKREAQTPGEVDGAIAKYRSVIDTHIANQRVFESAVRDLANTYIEAGRTEEALRYFITMVDTAEQSRRGDALREVFKTFHLKHPELVKKVFEEMRQKSAAQAYVPPSSDAQTLAGAILQRDDAELRQKSLEKLQTLIAADAPVAAQTTGLAALTAALPAKFDRAPLLPAVAGLLKSDDDRVRMLALQCLPGLSPTEKALDDVIPLVADAEPRVRAQVATALVQIGQGRAADRVIPALSKLLEDADADVVEQAIRSMWGQYSSPEFDALLIKISHQPRHQHNVIYFGFSTMRSKSTAVCQRLVEELDDPDWNNSGRAAWGLTYGVVDEAKPLVEAGLLRALTQETNPYTRGQEFRALAQVATEKSLPYLQSVIDSNQETDEIKQTAREILTHLQQVPR